MDKFFDCFNVKNTAEHISKKKPFLEPYSSIDHSLFAWLDEFLAYFTEWTWSVDEREGEFTANARRNMFLSWQTHKGLQMTVYSFKEVFKHLLQNGVHYVLSNRFCQNDLENYFGRQHAIASRHDSPSVHQVGRSGSIAKACLRNFLW